MKPVISSAFQTAYSALNPEQKRAVDAIEGPVIVIAGPGTGKTQILALRIAKIILETDTPPNAVLAIAFSESAVASMRKRLVHIMGERGYEVSIFTFHAFANSLIHEFGEAFPEFSESVPAEETDKIHCIEEALKTVPEAASLRPIGAPHAHIKKIIGAISALKRENIVPENFQAYIEKQREVYDQAPDKVHEKGAHKGKVKAAFVEYLEKIERNRALFHVYSAYESLMRKARLYDFDDMLISANQVLETHEYIKRIIQERYLYVLVDEHQDTNAAQNQLITHIVDFHERPNIFVVGDEKQAIYRFQGASIQNFMMLPQKYADVEIISLVRNYRSKQHILDVAHTVIGDAGKHEAIPRIRLQGEQNETVHVRLAQAQKQSDEVQWIVDRIAASTKHDIDMRTQVETTAVIVRENATAALYTQQLRNKGVTVFSVADEDMFDTVDGKRMLTLLQATVYPHENQYMAEVLLYGLLPLSLDSALSIIEEARQTKKTVVEVLKSRENEVYDIISDVVRITRERTVIEALGAIFTKCGVYTSIAHTGPDTQLSLVLKSLVREAEKMMVRNRSAVLSDFVERLMRMKDNDVRISIGEHISDFSKPGVYVLTAHKSKGLEFDQVYVPHAVESTWARGPLSSIFHIPDAGIISRAASEVDGTLKDEQAVLLDELRLFYVALTRAKHGVTISFSAQDESGKELTAFRAIANMSDAEVITIPSYTTLPLEIRTSNPRESIVQHVTESLLEHGLTVTALNNYIECPWKYVFMNALRMPFIQPSHLCFGTAMHAALEFWLRKHMKGEHTHIDEVYDVLRRSLERTPIAERDLEHFMTDGKNALAEYMATRTPAAAVIQELEYELHDIHIDVDGRTIELCGIIDRIEKHDGSLVVRDYKTGMHRSKNYILGKTKDSTGNMFRQLAFYKLLLSQDKKYKSVPVSTGIIDFVQPDEKNRLSYVECVLTDEDVRKVQVEIQKTVQSIIEGAYAVSECDDKKCEFCFLSRAIQ